MLELRTMLDKIDVDTRAVRRETTKARILEAAWELARREGVAAVALRDIARLVGMRAPSLYTYFPSKNALYDAMFAEGARQLADDLAQTREDADPRETLRARVRRFIAFCTADRARYQLLLERPVPGFEPTRDSLDIMLATLAGTRAVLEAAGVHGERALDLLRALITGLVSLQVANEPGGDRWTRLRDDALDMFLAYHVKQAGGAEPPV